MHREGRSYPLEHSASFSSRSRNPSGRTRADVDSSRNATLAFTSVEYCTALIHSVETSCTTTALFSSVRSSSTLTSRIGLTSDDKPLDGTKAACARAISEHDGRRLDEKSSRSSIVGTLPGIAPLYSKRGSATAYFTLTLYRVAQTKSSPTKNKSAPASAISVVKPSAPATHATLPEIPR